MLNIKPKRIIYRIIFPFTLLFVITTTITWFFSAYFITRYLDENLKQEMEKVAGIISKSSYIMNPAILIQVQKVINAEIVLYDQNCRVFSSTFSDSDIQKNIMDISKTFSDMPSKCTDIELDKTPYRTINYPLVLPDRGPVVLSLWMSTLEADRLKVKIVLSMAGIALFGIFAMVGIGYLIARTITAPVERLVRATGKISEGNLNERVHLDSRDEIGSLADSFNHMIDQLRAYEHKLVESEKMATAGQMVAGFAHEIRNPLTSIRMLAQVLRGHLKESTGDREILGSLIQEIDRLDRIINEMINRIRPGELKRRWDDLNLQTEEVIGVALEDLRAQQIDVKQNFSKDLPKIYIDAEKIKQVLWNLILNSKDAMPKGGQIIISTKMAKDRFVTLTVDDSGEGIVDGEMEQLFKPFFTSKPEGVGLGLTMSRKIVEQHGGELTLENRHQGGTRAIVMLPVSET